MVSSKDLESSTGPLQTNSTKASSIATRWLALESCNGATVVSSLAHGLVSRSMVTACTKRLMEALSVARGSTTSSMASGYLSLPRKTESTARGHKAGKSRL